MRKLWPIALLLLVVFGIGVYVMRGKTAPQTKNPVITQHASEPQSTCTDITTNVEEGPYYVGNMPQLKDNNLNYTHIPGEPIKIVGYVYGGTGKDKPLAGAKIDLWQADGNGVYHPEANGDISQYSSDQLALRGYILTDTNGRFEFTSIYPGYYTGRARHIHAKISADHYNPVTTQLIMQPKPGDGVIYSEDEDANLLPPCHLLEMTTINNVDVGAIDFRLLPE